MKRLFILASAAIVALASCTKTQVVYTEAPEEISFKTLTGAMTKATDLSETTISDMGVYASYTVGGAEYFEATKFEKPADGNNWGAEEGKERYWPANESLTFVAWAPFSAWSYDNTYDELTANVTSLTDILYGKTKPAGNKETFSTGVPVEMSHAAAQVVINFTGDAAAKLTSANLNNYYDAGVCTVSYTTPDVEWDVTSATKKSHEFTVNSTTPLTTKQTFNLLVVPVESSNTATITFAYTLNGSAASYTVEAATIGSWNPGSKHTYDVTIGAEDILIVPTVDDFTPETAVDAN